MNLAHLESLLACAVEAAQSAGRHALDHYRRRTEVVSRTPHDLKLQLDLECQEVAVREIRRWYPNHAWLGEEGGAPDREAEFCWVVDPIDGTVNFHHGLPLWCSSVAVLHRGQAVAGAIHLPMLAESYSATYKGPARCNESLLRVSPAASLAESGLATSVSDPAADEGRSLGVFRSLLPGCRKIRMLGSAAIHLCYVAAGRIDGYVEPLVHLWDCAAGGLLVARAGGRMAILDRPGPVQFRLLASNGAVHEEFVRAVRSGMEIPESPLPTPWDEAAAAPPTP